MSDAPVLYKSLGWFRLTRNGGYGRYRRAGQWMPPIRYPRPCQRGYHLASLRQMLVYDWIGPVLWVAEGRGDFKTQSDKTVFEQVRLVRRTGWNRKLATEFGRHLEDLAGRNLIECSYRFDPFGPRSAPWWQFQTRLDRLSNEDGREAVRWLEERL